MQVRALSAADAEQSQALRLQALRECPTAFSSSYEEECDMPLAAFAQRLERTSTHVVLGAFEGPQLVGTVVLERWVRPKLAHKAVVWAMYVAPPFRKRGVGRLLLGRLLDEAARMPGLQRVTLGVNATNAAAISLYESVGFRAFGGEPAFIVVDGVPQDEVHMAYVLERHV